MQSGAFAGPLVDCADTVPYDCSGSADVGNPIPSGTVLVVGVVQCRR